MKRICIIPARGGSKRIPYKNIRPFHGKPVINYAIETAHSCGLFEEVMVSTDDLRIADVAISAGAKVPFMRSNEASSDYASTIEVLLEVLQQYATINRHFDQGCCIYPCTPLLSKTRLLEAESLLTRQKFDLVFPVLKYRFPIQRSIHVEGELVRMNFPQYLLSRSQDLSENYHDAGQFYFFDVKSLLTKKSLVTDNTSAIEVGEMEAQDIDNETDWELAELKYKLINE